MRKWYRQIANKPTGSARGMTVLEQKIEDVMRKDKSVEPDVLGSSMRGQCKLLDNLLFLQLHQYTLRATCMIG